MAGNIRSYLYRLKIIGSPECELPALCNCKCRNVYVRRKSRMSMQTRHTNARPSGRGGVRSTRGLGPTMTARGQSIGISIYMLPQTLIMSRLDQLSRLGARIYFFIIYKIFSCLWITVLLIEITH
jgi:hypothetical protein